MRFDNDNVDISNSEIERARKVFGELCLMGYNAA
jgi:hypothetical protein